MITLLDNGSIGMMALGAVMVWFFVYRKNPMIAGLLMLPIAFALTSDTVYNIPRTMFWTYFGTVVYVVVEGALSLITKKR